MNVSGAAIYYRLDAHRDDGGDSPRPGGGVRLTLADRYARLRERGGARLADPRRAAQEVAADEFTQLRLAMLRALGDPSRFLIGELLRRHGPLATTELEAATGLASGTLSHHLRVLETARIVVPERVGGWVFWRLSAYPMIETLVPR